MLVAYLDESGTKESEIITIGGFVSDDTRWSRFSKEWSRILRLMDVKYIHMRECAHFQGEFKGWSRGRRDILIEKLIPIIRAHVKFKVAVSIDMGTYNKYFPTRLRALFGDPYYFCFREWVNNILSYCKKKVVEGQIRYVFDDQKRLKARAKRIYEDYRKNPNFAEDLPRLGEISFQDDKLVMPLQAADMLAYEANKFHRGAERKSFERLDTIPMPVEFWGARKLKG